MTDNAVKQQILSEFETMKLFEQDACNFYRKAATDPLVTDNQTRDHLRQIAEDEKHHVELVNRIINIIKNCL
jgi:rubrerythrin